MCFGGTTILIKLWTYFGKLSAIRGKQAKQMTASDKVVVRSAADIKWERLFKDKKSRELLKFALTEIDKLDAWNDVEKWNGCYWSTNTAGAGVQQLEKSIGQHPEGLSGAGISWVLRGAHELCVLGVERFATIRKRKATQRFKPYG
jgi:hypothetical protein